MSRLWVSTAALTGTLALLLAAFALAADTGDNPDTKKPQEKEPPDPAGTSMYMNYFRALFDQWDLDKDGYLDKEELAKAFRGSDAKPYDYKKPKKDGDPSDTKDDAKKDDAKKDDTKKDDTKKDDAKKDEKKPDYSKYPDYNFLVQLDQDGDEKISRHEFLSWARDLSVQLKQQADQQMALAQLQQRLANAKPNSKDYRNLQNQIKKVEGALQKVVDQSNKLTKALDKQTVQAIQKGKK
jgi:Ca2+-binding EF-hand superfamily protein